MDGEAAVPAGSALLVAPPDNCWCFWLAHHLYVRSHIRLRSLFIRAGHLFVSILSIGLSTQSPQSFNYSAVCPIFHRGNGGDARASWTQLLPGPMSRSSGCPSSACQKRQKTMGLFPGCALGNAEARSRPVFYGYREMRGGCL